jgi:hypothetical protein
MENERNYVSNKFGIDWEQRKQPIFIETGNRNVTLPMIFDDLGLTMGAEIGVERGVYSEQLCKEIPGLELYCIDPWKAYKGYREHVTQKKLDGFYEITEKKLAPYNCKLIRKFSMDAVNDFEDGSLDFVYIDGNHEFIHVAQDIAEWSKKVRIGGIVSGHDFKRQSSRSKYICHVKDVVQAWTYSHGIRPYFVLRGDKAPSWFWFKEK